MMKNVFYSLVIGMAFLLCSCGNDDDNTQKVALTLGETTTSTANITFEAVDGALMYDVDLAEFEANLEYQESIDAERQLSYSFENLKAGTKYTAKVLASAGMSVIGEGTIDFTTDTALEALVGSWKYEYNGNSITYTFNADGFGKYISSTGIDKIIRWEATDIKLTIVTFSGDISGPSTTNVEDYELLNESILEIDGVNYLAVQ